MSEKAEGKGESSNSVQGKVEKVDGPPSPKRIKLTDNVSDVKKMSRDSLLSKFQEQDKYINHLEEKVNKSSNAGELTSLRESEEKLKLQQQESTRRENVLVMRLATKEQEMQELLTQIHDLKQAQNPAGAQLRSTLLDPAVNIVFQRMKSELDETKEKLEQAQNDLSAWKFTPDSVTGKKLMAKCRMLIQENQELGRQLSQGRVAQLEAELALQKKYSEELKTSQDELNEFVIQLDEEVEGMQSTILTLQQQLKGVKNELVDAKQTSEKHVEQIRILEQNLDRARTQPPSPADGGKPGTVEDMQCDASDATDAEVENLESAHEAMQFECRNREPGKGNTKPEDKDSKCDVVEPELDKSYPDDVRSDNEISGPEIRTNENPEVKNLEPRVTSLGPEIDNIQQEVSNINEYPEIRDVQPELGDVQCKYSELQAGLKYVPPEFRNVLTEVNNVSAGVAYVNPRVENENPDKSNVLPSNENMMPRQENVQVGVENTTIISEYSKSITENLTTEDVPPRSLETVNQFSSPLEPNLRKSAGTPPCSTTFSISQILGEPKRTPSPDIPPGGDAVVTKIPYVGGYTDTAGDTLRTEGSGLLNGEGKDGTPALVTQRIE